MNTSKRALLYMDWPLASEYLQDIRQLLVRNRRDIEVETAGYLRPPQHDNYDIVICCDEKSAAPPAPLRICIFHGLASKGQAFSTARAADFLAGNTIYAVPGPYYAKLLRNMGVPDDRIWIIGSTKLDGLQRNILFAPTHNAELSAIPVVGNRIYELPNVRVMLHMYTARGDNHPHKAMRSHYPVHDTTWSSAENLEWADTVIGDFGSIILEAITLGKQAVQVINPQWMNFYLERKGLTPEEVQQLPEVYYPNRYAIQAHSFDDLYDLFHIMELGDSARRLYNAITSRID